MSGLLGSIDKFDPELEDWAQYVERVGQFFEANGIVGEENAAKRRSTFLSVVGPSPYKLLSSILAPVKPSEKTFEELTEVLRNHYSPPPSEVMQRFRFNTRSRKPGESVATYVAELRRLAEYCNYGNTLEKMIRDRLVSGINDDNIQKKLLSEPALSYTRALEIARGAEVAEKNLREMRAPRRERETAGPQATGKQDPVYQITSGKQPRKQSFGYCYCCGAPGHKIAECKFKDKSCQLCGKKGHLARMCKSPRTPQPGTQRSQNQRHLRQIRQVEDDPGGDSEDSLEEVQAVKAAPTPRNVSELKSYLGLLTYYGKFLPNLSTRLQPLYQLLTKDCQWKWSKAQEKAFQESKDLLQSSQLLVHFNPQLPIILACDASAFGIGAVLAHLMPDGSEKPIGYASRTLNKAERNYSQLEKEGLSCVFGIKHFYSYLFGHPFELITDHKPLLGLWGEKKPTSPQASARIRRWALYLSLFEYTLKFRRTSAHSNADALSRLPLPVEPAIAKTPPELVLLAEHLDNSPVTAEQIRIGTRRDPVLSQVMQFLQQGWPSIQRDNPQLTPFFVKKDELSLYNGCILWGTRVVVPVPYHDAVLTELHDGHPGMARMKSLARMYVWWPGIASDIEKTVRQCTECQLHQSTPPVAPLQPWQWPTRPWARLHLDYAGPVKGRMYLIIVDAHSKWIEAVCTPSATSAAVIEELNVLFAQFGLPDTIVTDNGTCFVSAEFAVYLKKYGIKHITSAPYHPATNGMAERAVQIVKQGLRKITQGSIRTRLAKILKAYRLTPHSTTGMSPAEMLLGRRPKSRLDLLKPMTAERIEANQWKQKKQHDVRANDRCFQEGDTVFVKNFQSGDKWLPGVISKRTGPVSFVVQLSDGCERRCHQDQLQKRTVEVTVDSPVETETPVPRTSATDQHSSSETEVSSAVPNSNVVPEQATVASEQSAHSSPLRKTYPTRRRTTVQRYEPML